MLTPGLRRRIAALWVCIVLLSGCAAAPQDPASGYDADAGPLSTMPLCSNVPEPSGDALPPGAPVPEDAIVTVVRESGPFIQVNGYVPRTPIEIMEEYEADGSLTVLTSEHEVVETELLVTDGKTRSFVKAVAVCDAGSALAVLLAPESEGDTLPIPAGQQP